MTSRLPAAVRQYGYQVFLLGFIPLGLLADAHVQSVGRQLLISSAAYIALAAALWLSPPAQRRQVLLAVVIATVGEFYFSVVVGLYVYRFHNLPLYVPAGHGLVYLFALTTARTPLVVAHTRAFVLISLGLATAWALAGVTVLPIVTGRVDMTGALLWPVFAWFSLRSRQAPVYAAAFAMTSILEICGTGFGNWQWAAIAPITHLHQGNPPSVIAGAYCLLDAAVIALTGSRSRPGATPVVTVPAEHSG